MKLIKLPLAALAFTTFALSTMGCALTSKADVLAIRYYTPENAKPTLTSSAAAPAPGASDTAPGVELGRVSSGINLREKIAFRDSTFEQSYYEDKRWTERPEVYVRRELERTLYEEHGFRRSLSASSPILEVEVVNFEEVQGQAHNARIRLKYLLHDGNNSLGERTVTVERPISGDGFKGVVQAMAQALDAASEEITADVERLTKSRAAAAPTPAAGPTTNPTTTTNTTTTTR